MAHDHQLPPSDRDETAAETRARLPIGDRLSQAQRPIDSPLLRIVPLTPRIHRALEALDSFNRPIFVPSIVVRRRLQVAIDEVETAIREALEGRRY